MTFSNRAPSALTLEAIAEAAAKLAAAPPVPSEITVAPDVYAALCRDADERQAAEAQREAFDGRYTRGGTGQALRLGGPIIHIDARLPAGTWHEGKPMPRAQPEGSASQVRVTPRTGNLTVFCSWERAPHEHVPGIITCALCGRDVPAHCHDREATCACGAVYEVGGPEEGTALLVRATRRM